MKCLAAVATVVADACQLSVDIRKDCGLGSLTWYYNRDSGKCEEFSYGTCGGNANAFATKEDCEMRFAAFLRTRFLSLCISIKNLTILGSTS